MAGLGLYLARYCYYVGGTGTAKLVLYIRRQTGLVAEQNACQQRGLRLRQNVRDDFVGARFESEDRRQDRTALIVSQSADARSIDQRVDALPSQIILVRKRGELRRSSQVAGHPNAIPILEIG